MQLFTADLHFGHRRIIELSNRPFASVEEMNERLILNWNAAVDPDDVVWVLGDVALGSIAESLPLVMELNGTKHLITGNHDRTFRGETRRRTVDVARYFAAGFVSVQDEAFIRLASGRVVQLSHFPFSGDSHGEDRHSEFRPDDWGIPLVHGHVHERFLSGISDRGTPHINVGVDRWDFLPVRERVLEEEFAALLGT